MKIEDMSTEELWKAKSLLLEQHIAIPQQLQLVNGEISKREKNEDTECEHESS